MIAKIVFQNIKNKPLNSLLSILLLSASVGIISLVMTIQNTTENHFNESLENIDLVAGAKGSPLQLVLSAVFQMDDPTGNIPLEEAEKLMKHPFVKKAIPLAYGDNYNGFKIVGATTDYINNYKATISEGKLFTSDFEVVIGHEVAQKNNLKIGDTFNGVHGSSELGEAHEESMYKVVGILKPTGTVLNQLIICNINSIWQTHASHDHEHHHEEGETCEHKEDNPEKEITAILFKVKNKMAFMLWPRQMAENPYIQIASPAIETNRLFSILGIGIQTLSWLAYAIMFISGVSIFIALYNNVRTKKQELALLRALGSGQNKLLLFVILESIFVAIIGFGIGIICSRLGLYGLSLREEASFLQNISYVQMSINEVYIFITTIGIALLAALIPGIMAFNLSISKTLSNGI